MTTPDTGSPAGAARHVADRSVAEGRPFAAIGPASPCGTAVGPSLKNAGRLVGGARFSPLILWGALTAAIAYVLAVNPVDRKPDLLGGCSWYAMFATGDRKALHEEWLRFAERTGLHLSTLRHWTALRALAEGAFNAVLGLEGPEHL